jgi:hypothetical protein
MPLPPSRVYAAGGLVPSSIWLNRPAAAFRAIGRPPPAGVDGGPFQAGEDEEDDHRPSRPGIPGARLEGTGSAWDG